VVVVRDSLSVKSAEKWVQFACNTPSRLTGGCLVRAIAHKRSKCVLRHLNNRMARC
jgi:hypothetical protein